jgi:FdhE protein
VQRLEFADVDHVADPLLAYHAMNAPLATGLAELARDHPEWRPWLALLSVAHGTFGDPLWVRAVPDGPPTIEPAQSPAPLLEGAVLTIDADGADRFVRQIFDVAESNGGSAAPLEAAARDARLDALAILEAAIRQDARGLTRWANTLAVEPSALRVVAGVAATPLLHACRRAWHGRLPDGWTGGYCPVCGAWPILAEARGLERTRHLRCSRCGGDWRTDWRRCPFCANADHATLGSLGGDEAVESRKIETCGACRGYLKSIVTLRSTPADALTLIDLDTVELDIAALEHGYVRPEEPGYRLRARVIAASQ